MVTTAAFLLAAYFGVFLIPEWWPAFRATPWYLGHIFTLPFVVVALIGCGCWGGIGVLMSRARNSPQRLTHRSLLGVSTAGLVLLAGALGVSAAIRDALPSGSHNQRFDPAAWKDEAASALADGGISARQQMLADVVTNVLPGRDRRALEAMLGPSLDTAYFARTDRDLIYLLGPERDSMFRVDSEWLLIWLDSFGRFKSYEIRVD